jgi:hypothetical protein
MDEATPHLAQVISWDPTLPVWADVNRYHPLVSASDYAQANKAHLIGVKISQGAAPGHNGHTAVAAAELFGLIVVGYEYGPTHPDVFLKLFPPKPGRIPCLDYEGSELSVAAAELWIQTVRAAYGRAPWFYGGERWVAAGEPINTAVAGCPWWAPEYASHLRVLRGVGKPIAWQFSNGVAGPPNSPRNHSGVEGNCDLSVLLCGGSELRLMAGLPVGAV